MVSRLGLPPSKDELLESACNSQERKLVASLVDAFSEMETLRTRLDKAMWDIEQILDDWYEENTERQTEA